MKNKIPKTSMGFIKRAVIAAAVLMLIPIGATMVLPMLLLVVPVAMLAAPSVVVVFASGARAAAQRRERWPSRNAGSERLPGNAAYADTYA